MWALARVRVRLPEDHNETDEDFLKKDGKMPFICEVFGDEEHKPFAFTNWDWWRPSDWVTLIYYWRDLLQPVLTYPEDFTGDPDWGTETIKFGLSEEAVKELWDNEEDEFWNDV